MSTVVLMRLLESAPDRYDAGMRLLSLGAVPRLQAAAATAAVTAAGDRVLEIGCGTGAVTRLLLDRGARVEAIDQDPHMLDRARARLNGSAGQRLLLRESTAAEIDALETEAYDAIVASLSLSEMSATERIFVLRVARRLLAPGGRLVIADEVMPRLAWQRVLHALLRVPLAALTWAITGSTSRPLRDLDAELRMAGFIPVSDHRSALGTLAVVVAVPSP